MPRLSRAPSSLLLTFVFSFAIGCLVNQSNARADIALSITNQGSRSFRGNWTLGYEFTANVDMNVTHLGFFDRDQDGLAQNHSVGIWDSAGNLVVTTSVGNSDPLTNFFRFRGVPPVMLTAGENYIIGAYDYASDAAIRSDQGMALTTSSDISIVTGRWVSGGSLDFPTNTINSSIFYPTVSFQFTTAIPEPGSGVMVLASFALLSRRRRFPVDVDRP